MRTSVILTLLCLGYSLVAQHSITGKVVDAESGEGLIGAHLYLLKDWRRGVISTLDGTFTLEIAEDQLDDSLIVSYVGFRETMVPVAQARLIKLEAIEVINEVVTVTAKRLIAEEFQYMEIKKLDIYTNPAAKADPLLAVNSLPSATTTDESANISFRGSNAVETGIFLNNVPVYDAVRYAQLNGIGTFSIFNTSIIENVTVFPGNPPLEFGNVTSGVIAMDTDQRTVPESTNSLVVSLANIGFSREQKLGKNQSLKVFTNWQPSDAMKGLNPRALEKIKRFTSNDLGIYWYGANEHLNWKVLSYSNVEGFRFDYEHPSFRGNFDQRKLRSFVTSSMRFSTKKGELSLNNGWSTSLGEYSYSNVSFDVGKRDLFGGLNYHLDEPSYSLKAGVSYDQRFAEVNGSFHQYDYAIGLNHPTVDLSEQLTIETLEAFVYYKRYLSDHLAIGTGLRKNIPLDSANYLSRQFNLSYQKGKWTTTFGLGKYYKAGLFENTGIPFRSESQQVSFDLNYSHRQINTTLTLYSKKALLYEVDYRVSGMELFVDYRMSDKVSASGSISWLDPSSASESPIFQDITYFVRANVSWKPGKFWTIESVLNSWQGSLFEPVASSVYETDLNVFRPVSANTFQRLPDYLNVGVSVSKIILVSEDLNFVAFASLNNVLDRKNLRDYLYSEDYSSSEPSLFSRRTGYVGVVVNF